MRISDWSSDVCSSDLCSPIPRRTISRPTFAKASVPPGRASNASVCRRRFRVRSRTAFAGSSGISARSEPPPKNARALPSRDARQDLLLLQQIADLGKKPLRSAARRGGKGGGRRGSSGGTRLLQKKNKKERKK